MNETKVAKKPSWGTNSVGFLAILYQFLGPNASRTRLQSSLIFSPKKWTQKNTVKETPGGYAHH